MKTIRFTLTLGTCLLLTHTTFALARQDCNINSPASTPTQRFNNHGNGTVTDTRTSLMWQTCLEGQNNRDCSGGGPERMYWQKADDTVQFTNQRRFATYTDWRLPTVAELGSIVEQRCQDPAINLEVFSHMPAVSLWSSNQSELNAVSLNFTNGKTINQLKGAGNYVRLVRNLR